MNVVSIQYISNDQGNTTGVVVPIELWRKIASELETDYLGRSQAMRQRLLEAMHRSEGVPLEKAAKMLELA